MASLILALIVGIASWMPERFGPAYLALPEGPGYTVRICAARCLVMVSTDTGPDRAMQRAGRVADRPGCSVSMTTPSRTSSGTGRGYDPR